MFGFSHTVLLWMLTGDLFELRLHIFAEVTNFCRLDCCSHAVCAKQRCQWGGKGVRSPSRPPLRFRVLGWRGNRLTSSSSPTVPDLPLPRRPPGKVSAPSRLASPSRPPILSSTKPPRSLYGTSPVWTSRPVTETPPWRGILFYSSPFNINYPNKEHIPSLSPAAGVLI